jgi:hypothetical protein
MSLTIEQTDTAIRETFYNMEEGVEYVLNDFWFQETNRVRKVYGYSPVKNRQGYKFTRKGDIIFVNNSFVFDFDGKHNLAFAFAFAFPLALALTLAFTLALQHNGLEKLKSDTCEGKVVEIDGKKYKLTAV